MHNIFANHMRDLERSGITPATAALAQIKSHDATSIARAVYGPRSGKAIPSDGYSIPFFNLDGSPMLDLTGQPLVRFRLSVPMEYTDANGKTRSAKYLSRQGAGHGLYIPPLGAALYEESDTLIITEGEKSSLKPAQEGLAVVGISGVYMWRDPAYQKAEGEKMSPETPLLPALAQMAKGKRVVVVADSDAADKPQVRHALRMLARAIRIQVRTKSVGYVAIPTGLDGTDAKLGLDDLLALEGGMDLFQTVLEGSESISPGFRSFIDYGRGATGVLQFRIPYPAAEDAWLPSILQEYEQRKDGEVLKEIRPLEAPYAWHTRILRVASAPDGVLLLDDPEHPMTLVDEIEGVTTDRRHVTLRLPAEDLMDPKRWLALGFYATPKGLAEWHKLAKASRESGKSPSVLATYNRGWVRHPKAAAPHFIYGEKVIAPEGAPELVPLTRGQAATVANSGIKAAGTYEGWLEAFQAVIHNPGFAVMAGFAASAPLLAQVDGMEPGIVNLVGASGSGKTTLLCTLAAMVGSPARPSSPGAYIGTWRATENGMESPLAAKSDSMVLMDEVHQAPQNMDWMSALYSTANGRGKVRMTKEVEERAAKAWRVQLISSGEESLASKVRASRDGRGQMPGGLQFRVIDLDCGTARLWSDVADQSGLDGGGRYGRLLGSPGGKVRASTVVEGIEAAFGRNHGHLWPRLIQWLQVPSNVKTAQTVYDTYRAKVDALCPPDASQVVRRRGKHVAAAMTGLLVLLAVTGIEDRELVDAAYTWAIEKFWKAGLEYTTGDEGEMMADRVVEAVISEPGRLYRPGDRWGSKDYWGWVNADGSVFLANGLGLSSLCTPMGMDPDRVKVALLSRGWSGGNARPPQGGRSAPKVRGIVSPPGLMEPMDSIE